MVFMLAGFDAEEVPGFCEAGEEGAWDGAEGGDDGGDEGVENLEGEEGEGEVDYDCWMHAGVEWERYEGWR